MTRTERRNRRRSDKIKARMIRIAMVAAPILVVAIGFLVVHMRTTELSTRDIVNAFAAHPRAPREELVIQLMDDREQSMAELEEFCYDEDPTVRIGTAIAYAELRCFDRPEYLKLIADPVDAVAIRAMDELPPTFEFNDAMLATLIDVACDERILTDRAFRAGVALYRRVTPRRAAYSGLVERVIDPEETEQCRRTCAHALQSIAVPEAARIVATFSGDDANVADVCLTLIPRFPQPGEQALAELRERIVNGTVDRAAQSGQVVQELGPRARALAPVVRDRLAAAADDPRLARVLLAALIATGVEKDDVNPPLLALAEHPDATIRFGVARIVRESGWRPD